MDDKTLQILEVAKQEFLANGFEKASMRTIASKACVTTGALYARFPNKDEMFGI
ncbi:MAG: helix-turn-helix domain-containing protein [Eubacteriales bacterium]